MRKGEAVVHIVPMTVNHLRFLGYFGEWCLCPGGAYALANTSEDISYYYHQTNDFILDELTYYLTFA